MLRIATNNAAQRLATLTGDTNTAYPPSNMLVDCKSLVCRSSPGNHGNVFVATWTTPELVGVVALPFCNLTPTAAWRVRVWSDTAGTNLVYDTTAALVTCCPAPAVVLPGFTALQASTAYAYGGGACARHWFTPVMCGKLQLDIIDPNNPAIQVETSRLFVANWWSPTYNADIGAQLTFASASSQVRSDGGDLLTNIGPRFRKLSLNLSNLPASDRAALADILRATGLSTPLFVSVFPGDADTALERDYTIYGKLSALSVMTWGTVNTISMPLEIEEM